MDRQHGRNRFSTVAPVIDYTDGFTALRLYETLDGQTKECAEIVFWDACGQFVLRTIDTDIPIEIIEDFIAEARDVIRVR